MKKKKILIVLALIAFFTLGIAAKTTPTKTEDKATTTPQMVKSEKWIHDLEGCESGFDETAINPEDLDGTPSYGCFQFKPGTFIAFSARYHLRGELMDCNAQREIVRRMVAEAENINWEQQFPGCVAKLGRPIFE